MSCRCLQGCLNKFDAACTLPLLSISHRLSLGGVYSCLHHKFCQQSCGFQGQMHRKGIEHFHMSRGIYLLLMLCWLVPLGSSCMLVRIAKGSCSSESCTHAGY